MNSRSGSVSIEAAVILPFIMFIFATLIYLNHITYVENVIYANMLIAGHEVAMSGVVLDEIDMVDDLQDRYQAGDEIIGEAWEQYSEISFIVGGADERVTGLLEKNNEILSEIDSLKEKQSVEEMASTSIGIIENFFDVKNEISSDVNKILDAIKFFANNGKTLLVDGSFALSVCFFDEIISKNYIMGKFGSLVSDEDLDDMNVQDFRVVTSRYMLPDDSLAFTYSYEIYIPFFSDFLGEKYEDSRDITVRAYTGSYDARDVKSKKEKTDNAYVYIATSSPFNKCYHTYSCLRKPLESALSFEAMSRAKCKYCKKHYNMGTKIYYVSGNSKVHYSKDCPKIYSKNIKKMTEDDARKLGFRTCMKRGCTGGK